MWTERWDSKISSKISNKPSWLRKTTDGLAEQLTDDIKVREDKLAIQIDPNILPSIKGLDQHHS